MRSNGLLQYRVKQDEAKKMYRGEKKSKVQ